MVIQIVCEEPSSQSGVKISIYDQGVPFNPIEKAPKTPPSSSPLLNQRGDALGGYGIYILIGVMDEVEYQRLESGNKLSLTKYLKESEKGS